jgi:hypothetical protein
MLTLNQQHIVAKFFLATQQERVYGCDWYAKAYQIASVIASEFGLQVETVAGVISALSPNNKWERNCQDAENLIAAYMAGGKEAAAGVKVCTYGKNKEKAIAILSCDIDQIAVILNGRKVVAFYYCISQIYLDRVVIDGHAYSIWLGERLTMKEVPSIGKKLYESIVADYVAAAAYLNKEHDLTLTGYQLQAITWVCHKRIHGV